MLARFKTHAKTYMPNLQTQQEQQANTCTHTHNNNKKQQILFRTYTHTTTKTNDNNTISLIKTYEHAFTHTHMNTHTTTLPRTHTCMHGAHATAYKTTHTHLQARQLDKLFQGDLRDLHDATMNKNRQGRMTRKSLKKRSSRDSVADAYLGLAVQQRRIQTGKCMCQQETENSWADDLVLRVQSAAGLLPSRTLSKIDRQ